MNTLMNRITGMYLLFVFLSFTGCKNPEESKLLQTAAQNFASGDKNFFESYGLETDGTFVSGRVIYIENSRKIGTDSGTYVELDSGDKFVMMYNEELNIIYPRYVTHFEIVDGVKRYWADDKNGLIKQPYRYFDENTIKDLYIQAIVKDGVSLDYVCCSYNNRQQGINFLKNGAKSPTKKSTLDINDEKYNKKYDRKAKSTGRSKVVHILICNNSEAFYLFYLENGVVLSIDEIDYNIDKNGFYNSSENRGIIKVGDEISYVVSDMSPIYDIVNYGTPQQRYEKDQAYLQGKKRHEYFTNILDYFIEK